MTEERFIKLLQEIISMTDPKDQLSINTAMNVLSNLKALAIQSGKTSGITLEAMELTMLKFRDIMHHKKDFEGILGDVVGNKQRRARLKMVVVPHC